MSLPRWKVAVWLAGSAMLMVVPLLVDAQPGPDLSEFKTVENAVTTKIRKGSATQAGSPGYLGVLISLEKGKLTVGEVEDNSPAEKAGLKKGDHILKVDGKAIKSADVFRSLMQAKLSGEKVELSVERGKETMTLSPALIATSRMMTPNQQKGGIGVTVEETKDGIGIQLKSVNANGPAEEAGLKIGDVLLKLDGKMLDQPTRLGEMLGDRKPGDSVTLMVKNDNAQREVKLTLIADIGGFGKGKGGKGGGKKGGGGFGADNSWDTRNINTFRKDTYRLAIVGIEYADVKHNDKINGKHWEDSLFSQGTYKTSATGSKTYGSMNDYYQEQSFGKLKVQGKFFPFVAVSKKRNDYAAANTGPGKTAMLTEALDKLYARDGKDALKDFDGIFFLHAGGRVQTNRGGIFWPHKSFVSHGDKRWPYFIVQEGGEKQTDISVICHEFGHMLGLPDLYARPENPGSEGVGVWCAMSNQAGLGKPQHFSAWSKEQLGWVTPAVIDPSVKQKLILAPIENSSKECFKVLARPDGSEYFLLENRKKKGFDASLPAEGLLIWRVIANRPILEESHGVEGPIGPRVFLDSVPFPSKANNAFTPFTTPSSRSQLGGGSPVHITNIRRLPDGRVTFYVGYEYY